MKTKSKLLLALSALTVGTVAAGTTATFAWFTTNRTATAHMTNVTASNRNGNLKIAFTGLGNSTVLHTAAGSSNPSSNSTGTDVTAKFNQDLRDLSSKDGSKFYAPVWDASKGSGTYSGGNHAKPQGYKKYNTTTTEHGYIQFYLTIENTGASELQIFLDPSLTAINAAATKEEETDQKTANEALASFMRVAVVASKTVPGTYPASVDLQSAGSLVFMDGNNNYDDYVTGESSDLSADDGLSSYTGEEHFFDDPGDIDDDLTAIAAEQDGARTGHANYIGNVEADGGNDTIYVAVAIWMEGTCADSDAADGGIVDIDLGFTALEPNPGA